MLPVAGSKVKYYCLGKILEVLRSIYAAVHSALSSVMFSVTSKGGDLVQQQQQ